MAKPLTVYVGWDERDALAYGVVKLSIEAHASKPVDVRPLYHWVLRAAGLFWREWRMDGRGQIWDARTGEPMSTTFSLTRYCVPGLAKAAGQSPVVFIDADMMFLDDIHKMVAEAESDAVVSCVKHVHRPVEREKMGGTMQVVYERKNWSSVMVIYPGQANSLTPYRINNETKIALHSLAWADKVGEIDERWNWLCGWSSLDIKPGNVHYTRGTPDMPGCESEPFKDEWWAYARRVTG